VRGQRGSRHATRCVRVQRPTAFTSSDRVPPPRARCGARHQPATARRMRTSGLVGPTSTAAVGTSAAAEARAKAARQEARSKVRKEARTAAAADAEENAEVDAGAEADAKSAVGSSVEASLRERAARKAARSEVRKQARRARAAEEPRSKRVRRARTPPGGAPSLSLPLPVPLPGRDWRILLATS
jgi:hypothetical protein